jgi:hypothetical protein
VWKQPQGLHLDDHRAGGHHADDRDWGGGKLGVLHRVL